MWHNMKFTSNLASSAAHLAMLPVTLGLWSMAFSGYDVTTETCEIENSGAASLMQ
jgi:hypothetical protein